MTYRMNTSWKSMLPLNLLDGFVSLQTQHCVTGSLRQIYAFNGHNLSEEMLLGLGEGVGFMYWHAHGQSPFLGGRAVPKPSMEELAGERSGVQIMPHTTLSPRKARQTLIEILDLGQPVMLQVDMGFLPYFDFEGQEYHFGGHVVVACGRDAENNTILIADRDGIHPVPSADLERARASTYKPFPPRNTWWTFDFSGYHSPTPIEIRQAIAAQASGMLAPPIHNFGIKGIRLAAKRIPEWPGLITVEEVRQALFNVYIFISPVGGSGGGLFRYMFSRFLNQAATILGDEHLDRLGAAFQQIGDAWESVSDWARQVSALPNPLPRLAECSPMLREIADQEQTAWEALAGKGE